MRRLEYLADGTDTVLDQPEEEESGRPLAPVGYRRDLMAPVEYGEAGPDLSPREYRNDRPAPVGYRTHDEYLDGIGALPEAQYAPHEESMDGMPLPKEYRELNGIGPDDGEFQSDEKPVSRTPKLDALEAMHGQMPQRTQPKWYQRLGAAALGGAVGWSNAAGRARPIDDAQAVDNILYPGYQSKLADWKSRVIPVQAQAEIEAERNKLTRQDRLDTATAQLHLAEANAANEHAAYWSHRAQTEANRYGTNAKGQVYDKFTGEVKNQAPTTRERFDEAKALGVDDEQARYYALNGKMEATPKPVKPRSRLEHYIDMYDGDEEAGLEAMRKADVEDARAKHPGTGRTSKPPATRATPGQFLQIEKDKTTAMAKAKAALEKANAVPGASTKDLDAAYKTYNEAIGLAQNSYLEKIRVAGGNQVPAGVQTAAGEANAVRGGQTPGPRPTPLDSQVKAYADKYFGGDVAQAKAEIAKQQQGR